MVLDYFPLDYNKVNSFFEEAGYFDKGRDEKLFEMFDDRFCKFIKNDGTICGRKSRIIYFKNCCKQHLNKMNKNDIKEKNKYYVKKQIIYKCIWKNKYNKPCQRNVKNNGEFCCFHKKISKSNEFEKNQKTYILPKEKRKDEIGYINPSTLEEYRNYDCVNFLESLKNFEINILSYNYTKIKNKDFNFVIKNNYYYDNNNGSNGKGVLNLIIYMFNMNIHDACKYIEKNKHSFSFFSLGNNKNNNYSDEFKKNKLNFQNPLEIPKKDDKNIDNIKNYLILKRHINRNIIIDLINKGRLYSDNYSNCIFTNKINNFCIIRGTGKKRYVSCRGIPDYITYRFGNSDDLFLFESSIDILSYKTLNSDKEGTFVSTNGSMMINKFLNFEKINKYKNLYICLDNDKQGNLYSDEIRKRFKNEINIIRIKSINKDFNEDLIKSNEF